jgi:hypothetical protein
VRLSSVAGISAAGSQVRSVSGSVSGTVLTIGGAGLAHLPLTRKTLLSLLYRCGYRGKMSVHGFRATFSSIMNERHGDASRPSSLMW